MASPARWCTIKAIQASGSLAPRPSGRDHLRDSLPPVLALGLHRLRRARRAHVPHQRRPDRRLAARAAGERALDDLRCRQPGRRVAADDGAMALRQRRPEPLQPRLLGRRDLLLGLSRGSEEQQGKEGKAADHRRGPGDLERSGAICLIRGAEAILGGGAVRGGPAR